MSIKLIHNRLVSHHQRLTRKLERLLSKNTQNVILNASEGPPFVQRNELNNQNISRPKVDSSLRLNDNSRVFHWVQKRLTKLNQQIEWLQKQIKITATAALTAGTLFIANQASGQVLFDPVQSNPFGFVKHSLINNNPAIGDLDGDGDTDLMLSLIHI